MGKALELVGLALIGGTILSFTTLIPQKSEFGWPIFWICAGGALGIILYRKKQRSKAAKSSAG